MWLYVLAGLRCLLICVPMPFERFPVKILKITRRWIRLSPPGTAFLTRKITLCDKFSSRFQFLPSENWLPLMTAFIQQKEFLLIWIKTAWKLPAWHADGSDSWFQICQHYTFPLVFLYFMYANVQWWWSCSSLCYFSWKAYQMPFRRPGQASRTSSDAPWRAYRGSEMAFWSASKPWETLCWWHLNVLVVRNCDAWL